MFEQQIYRDRRKKIIENINSGLLLFLGNDESPSNYLGNTYAFRQDSTFLYYVGLDIPGLAVVIDVDSVPGVVPDDAVGDEAAAPPRVQSVSAVLDVVVREVEVGTAIRVLEERRRDIADREPADVDARTTHAHACVQGVEILTRPLQPC